MKVQPARATVNISATELLAIVKAAILKETGREIDGDVYYDMKPGASSMPTAYCYLKPATEPA